MNRHLGAVWLLAEPDFAKPFTKAPEPLSCRWSIEGQTVWMSVEKIPGNYDAGSVARTRSVAVVRRLFS